MFIPNLSTISGVSCRIGMGGFVDLQKQAHLFDCSFWCTCAGVYHCTYQFHHPHHLIWCEVVVYHQVMWWMPIKRHSWFYHPQILICKCRMLLGILHANVGHEVTLITLSKGYFVPIFTYDGLVMLRVHPQQHKQPTNTTTLVMELLAPPAAWIQWYNAAQVAEPCTFIFQGRCWRV